MALKLAFRGCGGLVLYRDTENGIDCHAWRQVYSELAAVVEENNPGRLLRAQKPDCHRNLGDCLGDVCTGAAGRAPEIHMLKEKRIRSSLDVCRGCIAKDFQTSGHRRSRRLHAYSITIQHNTASTLLPVFPSSTYGASFCTYNTSRNGHDSQPTMPQHHVDKNFWSQRYVMSWLYAQSSTAAI
ncbi:hypothetical protein BJV77DRAFT_485657 [Russula vinacea]|nr:hypothetical protein BJV77DRAFT_485657 [Russula vinacea]